MSEELSLFVYGSFSENSVHYQLISNFIESKKSARVKGQAYRLEVGYPIALRDDSEGARWISGELVKIKGSDTLFKILDEFHGYSSVNPEKSLFLKSEIEVFYEDGGVETAMIYTINPTKLPKTSKLIESGDWKASMQEQPALTEFLTPRQSEYIKKLGASTGRDIVPIDLDLYRQLLKLEMIVDKGRRLALTRLGKEVYRYLPK